MPHRNRKAKDYIEAIRQSHGVITSAAAALGVSRRAVYNARDRYKSVADALEDERERMLDVAETRLFEKIYEGDRHCIFFLLETQGKSRGYARNAIEINLNKPINEMTDAELEQLALERGIITEDELSLSDPYQDLDFKTIDMAALTDGS